MIDNAVELRDIKPPVGLPSYDWILFVVLLVIVVLGVFYFWYKTRRRITVPVVQSTVIISAWDRAYQRLDELVNGPLIKNGQWETYYLTLADIIRRYFEERFDIRAPEMTSEEFLVSLRGFSQLSGSANNVLKEFLDSCDIVKFARYQPHEAEAQKTTLLGRRLVNETKPVV